MRKRALLYLVRQQLQHKNAHVITGMRQVRKISLMQQLFQSWEGKKL